MLHYCIYQEERSSDNTSKLYTISSNIMHYALHLSVESALGQMEISAFRYMCVCVFFFPVPVDLVVQANNEIYHLRLLLMRTIGSETQQTKNKYQRLSPNAPLAI